MIVIQVNRIRIKTHMHTNAGVARSLVFAVIIKPTLKIAFHRSSHNNHLYEFCVVVHCIMPLYEKKIFILQLEWIWMNQPVPHVHSHSFLFTIAIAVSLYQKTLSHCNFCSNNLHTTYELCAITMNRIDTKKEFWLHIYKYTRCSIDCAGRLYWSLSTNFVSNVLLIAML